MSLLFEIDRELVVGSLLAPWRLEDLGLRAEAVHDAALVDDAFDLCFVRHLGENVK